MFPVLPESPTNVTYRGQKQIATNTPNVPNIPIEMNMSDNTSSSKKPVCPFVMMSLSPMLFEVENLGRSRVVRRER